jgi:glyoxylase-like metal-dependent hydrolase (beta-lactamase superfamily II)
MAEKTNDGPADGPADAPAASPAPAQSPIITTIPVGALEANCYLVTCPRTRATLIVDPGDAADRILDHLRAHGGEVTGVLHTHGHFDHIGATEAVLAGLPTRVPLAAHPADRYLYDVEQRAVGTAFGYAVPETAMVPDVALTDEGMVEVGDLRLRVVHTPGHTPGSISLVCGDVCLSGDTLFRRGIGRTDLLGGDEEAIYDSILTRLYPLPPETRVYPGHGSPTTIGEERRANPFIRP